MMARRNERDVYPCPYCGNDGVEVEDEESGDSEWVCAADDCPILIFTVKGKGTPAAS